MATGVRQFRARRLAVSLAALFAGVSLAAAQPARIIHPLDASKTKVLQGNRPLKARFLDDEGPLNPFDQLTGLTLIFRPSREQSADLNELLKEQRDPSSPNYQAWLTPEQYADRFGLNQGDLEQMLAWLRGQGFSIDDVARSRTWIKFSGASSQVGEAFHTEIHRYYVNGERHFANWTDPSIPSALDPVVLSIRGLDDFRTAPKGVVARFNSSSGGHSLVPGDIATIYDIGPLYQKGITGAGQKIAVVGQSDIHLSDIEQFRKRYGLPVNNPELVLVAGSPDPGVRPDDLIESSLDLEYAGAIAPDAKILFVYSTDVWTSIEYVVDKALAPVISTSYGFCEPQNSIAPASTAAYFQSVAQQANAMGITWVAASGDTGAADCDQTSEQVAKQGLAVDLPASVPEVTGVGGTQLMDGTGQFWGPTNNGNGSSALSYIPERAWNDTASIGALLSTGGGASVLYAKPDWQNGTGVPDDKARDVPDVSFAGAMVHDPYQIYANGGTLHVGGTSAPAPVFAGMLALLNQYLVVTGARPQPGLGNINPMLYRLAQSTPEIFHDGTVGSNIVPCATVSPNCSSGQFGFNTGIGYDQATGLGSLDVYKLVTQWNGKPIHHLGRRSQ